MSEEEYQQALNNITGTFGTLRDQIAKAFEIGRAASLTDMKIGDDIRVRIRGLISPRTIQAMLPETAKHQEKKNVRKNILQEYAAKSSAYPEIPPPKQEIVEVSDTRALAPKQAEITLDLKKFGNDLRVPLINKSKVVLTLENGEVTKVKEI